MSKNNNQTIKASGLPSPSIDLLACPFCGDKDWLEIHDDKVYKPEVICTTCGASMQAETVAEAVVRWNTRAS